MPLMQDLALSALNARRVMPGVVLLRFMDKVTLMKPILLSAMLLFSITLSFAAIKPTLPKRQQGTSGERLTLTAAEIAELINETGRRMTLMTMRVADYTYTREDVERKLDGHGQVKRENFRIYEGYPAPGRVSVLVQLSENGVPRSTEQIERDRRRAARELVEA